MTFNRHQNLFYPCNLMKVCRSKEYNSFIFIRVFKEGRRRLFIDSPKQDTINSTPQKTSGVMKQLFTSPPSSLKRTLPASLTLDDKRQKLFHLRTFSVPNLRGIGNLKHIPALPEPMASPCAVSV